MDFCDMQIKIEYALTLVKTEEEELKIRELALNFYIHYRELEELKTSLQYYINEFQTRGK